MSLRRLVLSASLLLAAVPAAASARPPDGLWAGRTVNGQNFFFFVSQGGTRAGGFAVSNGNCTGGDAGTPGAIDVQGRFSVSDDGDEGSGTLFLKGRLTTSGTGGGTWGSSSRADDCAASSLPWTAKFVRTTSLRGSLLAGPVLSGASAAWVEQAPHQRWRVRRGHGGPGLTVATIPYKDPRSRVLGLDASAEAIAVSLDPFGGYYQKVYAGGPSGPLRHLAGTTHDSVARVDGRLVVDEPKDGTERLLLSDALTGKYARATGPNPPDPFVGHARIAGDYVAYRHAEEVHVARLTTRDLAAAPALVPLYAVDGQGLVSFSVDAAGDLLVTRPSPDFEFTHRYELVAYHRADPATPQLIGGRRGLGLAITRLPTAVLDSGRVTFLGDEVPDDQPLEIQTANVASDDPLTRTPLSFPYSGIKQVGDVVGRGTRLTFAFRIAHRRGKRLVYGPVHVAVIPRG